MDKGLFITFEGIDGCGKSSQITRLAGYFDGNNIPYLLLREPGGTVVGEKIRNVLLDKKNDNMNPICELLLFEAARAQIVDEVIRPNIDKGTIVICDRFFDSTYAYQGHARGLGSEMVKSLNLIATAGLEPAITFLFDLDPAVALERRGVRGEADDRLEALGMAFQASVREGYLDLASKTDRIVTVDASKTREEIFEVVKGAVEDRLGRRGN